MDIFDIALAMTPRVGGRVAKILIEHFGSAKRIFNCSAEELIVRVSLNKGVAEDIAKRIAMPRAEQEAEYCHRNNIEIIASTDRSYPQLLALTYDPPHIIYCQGNNSILNDNLISIVGTRRNTQYGARVCRMIIEQIDREVNNAVIVSGLAHGTDASAHYAALDLGIPTIAILPSSLPKIAPSSNRALAHSIVEAGGTLISEQHSSSPNIGRNYISRNRIIAGVSASTIIIESSLTGGSLSTANIANNEGRLVGAVPGRITDEYSGGCNNLIAKNIAIPITSGRDIVSTLGWQPRKIEIAATPEVSHNFSSQQRGVLLCFREENPLHISELEELTQLSSGELSTILLELELQGAITTLPGALYERTIPLRNIGGES